MDSYLGKRFCALTYIYLNSIKQSVTSYIHHGKNGDLYEGDLCGKDSLWQWWGGDTWLPWTRAHFWFVMDRVDTGTLILGDRYVCFVYLSHWWKHTNHAPYYCYHFHSSFKHKSFNLIHQHIYIENSSCNCCHYYSNSPRPKALTNTVISNTLYYHDLHP